MSNYVEVRQDDPEPIHTISLEMEVDSIDRNRATCRYCELQNHKLRRRMLAIHILLTLCLFLSLSFLYLRFRQPTEQEAKRKDQDCVRRLSSYTPALEAIEYHDTEFDYSMNQFRDPSIEEQEEAWLGLLPLGHHKGVLIDVLAMPLLNHTNLDAFEKVQPEEGDGYFALLNLHVQLECLYITRQYIWLLTGNYSADRIPDSLSFSPEQNRMHVDYCIDNLRQNIMCQGDMTPIMVTKERKKESSSKLEYTSHHKCRNFTKLQEWAISHGIESEAAKED